MKAQILAMLIVVAMLTGSATATMQVTDTAFASTPACASHSASAQRTAVDGARIYVAPSMSPAAFRARGPAQLSPHLVVVVPASPAL